jgi:Ca-activated chloride channel family protein
MKHTRRSILLPFAAAPLAAALGWRLYADTPETPPGKRGAAGEASGKAQELEIDLDQAQALKLPKLEAPLKPVQFATADGKTGWVVQIPGGRPIATPAVADGLLFVGGGYGSHEFYAFHAATGALAWQGKTPDDGPSAAVVEDGLVAFNTESCTLVVVEATTGKTVWQEWLGDPLMSQPAIANGRVFVAYPAGQRGGQHNQQLQQAPNAAPNAAPQAKPTQVQRKLPPQGHRLLCADLKTGAHVWEQALTADVVSAPVIDGDKVYLTCFDGTAFCLEAKDGAIVWTKKNAAASAPVVAQGQVVLTERGTVKGQTVEGIRQLDPKAGKAKSDRLLAAGKADYLKKDAGGGVGMSQQQAAQLDSSVGFSTAPQAAGLTAANEHLGVRTVAGGWAYQGSKVGYRNGSFFNAQGRGLNCMGADGTVGWRAQARGAGVAEGGQVFVPPALGDERMFVCSTKGHLLSVDQKTGAVRFAYATGVPMAFQPALDGGRMLVGTSNGLLVCLDTGDPDADGWTAWGGNAQHNKK